MPEVDSGPTTAVHSHQAHAPGGEGSSRFRRFFKRFGRRPSDEEQHDWPQSGDGAASHDAAGSPLAGHNAQLHGGGGGASRARRGTATGATGTSGAGAASSGGGKSKWFGQGGGRSGFSSGGAASQNASASRPGSSPATGSAPLTDVNGGSRGFGTSTAPANATSSGVLSSTADTAAPERSPPPQLMQLPSHEPMVASEMHPRPASSIGDGGSSFNHARTHPRSNSSDLESLDRRTVDTGKSRASTKPTTLMSLEMRDQPPMAHIATHRHGEASSSAPRAPGTVPAAAASVTSGGTTAVQFVNPDLGRSASGTIVNLPGHEEPAEDAPFVNVPALSRPHPANNPSPHGQPPDNASVLTLASSTAAQSIGGGAPSSRGHQAYSIGTRSIRRNSSDTYASLMALPPLSRRGSNESGHSGWTGGHPANLAGPGAPSDRVSVQRTPSQRTVATQLSIPFSASASNAGGLAASIKGNVAGAGSINGGGGGGGGGEASEGRPSLGDTSGGGGGGGNIRTAASRIMEEAKKKESVKEVVVD